MRKLTLITPAGLCVVDAASGVGKPLGEHGRLRRSIIHGGGHDVLVIL